MNIEQASAAEPHIERVMHELVRRPLTVLHTRMLTPRMKRITLGGEALHGFRSAAADDHIKLFFPVDGGKPEMRDYTPRLYDADANTLIVDFVIHEGGVASAWAEQAEPGQTIEIGGPRGSRIIRGDIAEWLFIGDEAAIPAMARFVEELPATARATLLVSIHDDADRQAFESAASIDVRWQLRGEQSPSDVALLDAALAEFAPKPGCFVWVATEVQVARALRRSLIERHTVSARWIKVAGYWTHGLADAAEQNIED
ncbi:MAG TPA: siderophore-interacting protein [Pseudoxanthomonas sp.]|nr:siderophore-interacting protein [Pseudoxanthomonas sp.]